jgi:uroporphyrinogen decarboxylase
MLALLTRQRPDRVPFIPFAFGFCARNVGYPVSAAYADAEQSFWSQLWTSEQYGYDGGPLYGYASQGAWEFGGELEMPVGAHQAPWVSRAPATTPAAVEALEIPEVESAGAYRIAIPFARLQQKLGMPVTFQGFSPFTNAGNIAELPTLLRWIVKEPKTVHLLLSKCIEFHRKVVDYFTREFAGSPIIMFFGEPSTANAVISPRQFETFALPYLREMNQYAVDKGVRHIFAHLCGEQNKNLSYWSDMPYGDPGIISVGHEVDLTRAIEVFGDQHIIAGNVEPQRLQLGTSQEVYDLTRQALEKGKRAPNGFILMGGCEIPVNTPPYNIFTMKKAVMEHGFYDDDGEKDDIRSRLETARG